MAIPEDRKSISTNLPLPRLEKILQALEDGNVEEVPESDSLVAEVGSWEVDFEGARYRIIELVEEVVLVYLVSANPGFVQALIDGLEIDLSVVVGERDYDAAKAINNKIENLRTLLDSKRY